MIFLILLTIPLLIALVSFWFLKGITLKEFLFHLVVQVIIAGASAGILYYKNVTDTEILSGVVTEKYRDEVSCSHSYQCMCITTCSGGKNSTCTTICQTCYLHSFDVDWIVKSTVQNFEIDRLSSQGLEEPPRWTSVQKGDPVAVASSYENYIKAAPDTLFKTLEVDKSVKYLKTPEYPDKVYNYYYVDRAVIWGSLKLNLRPWNIELQKLNGEIGRAAQANVVLVFTSYDSESFQVLERAWLGGKKNDIVVVIGTDGEDIYWTRVMAWSTDKLIQVKLRDAILDVQKLDRNLIIDAIKANIKFYHRKPMADFKYLASTITPTPTQLIISIIFGMLVSCGLSWWLSRTDLFNEEWSSNYNYANFRARKPKK